MYVHPIIPSLYCRLWLVPMNEGITVNAAGRRSVLVFYNLILQSVYNTCYFASVSTSDSCVVFQTKQLFNMCLPFH